MKSGVYIITACLFGAITPAYAAGKTCEQLWQVSARQMASTRRTNLRIPSESSEDRHRRIAESLETSRKNRWAFESPSGTNDYIFAPADIDGDGRLDQVKTQCGAPTLRRICFMKLSLANGKSFEQQSGFLYLAKVNRRFYAIWDHFEPEAQVVEGSFSQYYRLDGRGFTEVCKTADARKHNPR